MARIGASPRATGTFRLPYVARNDRAPERARSLIEPVHRGEDTTEFSILDRQSGQPFADRFAFPPRSIANLRESITVKPRADVMGRRVGTRIIGEERERAPIVV